MVLYPTSRALETCWINVYWSCTGGLQWLNCNMIIIMKKLLNCIISTQIYFIFLWELCWPYVVLYIVLQKTVIVICQDIYWADVCVVRGRHLNKSITESLHRARKSYSWSNSQRVDVVVDADMGDDVFDLCSRRCIHQLLKVLKHSKVYFPFPRLLFHHLSFTLACHWERQHFYLLVEMFMSDFYISKLVKPTNQNPCKHQSEYRTVFCTKE